MPEYSIVMTILITAIAFWFAHVWYINEQLKYVHKRLDHIMETFDGLRDYLYEIDPQFDDERENSRVLENDESLFAGLDCIETIKRKKEEGKRTLNTPFVLHHNFDPDT